MTLARCRTADDVIVAGEATRRPSSCSTPRSRGGVLRALPDVRAVGRYGVGLDTDRHWWPQQNSGWRSGNVPDYCVDEVADHALGLILALTRGIVALDRGVQHGTWDFRLAGRVRRASSQRLGDRRAGTDRDAPSLSGRSPRLRRRGAAIREVRGPTGLTMIDLPTLLATSDIVSVHAPLNESDPAPDRRRRARPDAADGVLVNTSRGGACRLDCPGRRLCRDWSDRRRRPRRPRARADRAGRPARSGCRTSS